MEYTDTLKQTNAYAMQNGALLGGWSLLCGALLVAAMSWSGAGWYFVPLAWATPVVCTLLTLRFREKVAGRTGCFSFGRGFAHTFLMSLYASVWLALGVYLYLAYFDHGAVFDAYGRMLADPSVAADLERSGMAAEIDLLTEGRGPVALADMMRAIPTASYSAMVIYFAILSSLPVSAIIALIARRKGHEETAGI